MIVQAPAGPIRGRESDGVWRFAGIPYAAAPTGDLRFRPPVALDPWTEPHDGAEFGPISPQNPSALGVMFPDHVEVQSEDCLNLNVWTPQPDGSQHPVMVWIHGGAFKSGSGSSPLYHGDSLVGRGDVVVVTINYRLAALGFTHLAHLDESFDGSGNNGLLDQVLALTWVQNNIASFGGDPDNVTVFGESAGAMSIGALLAIAGDGSLFRRAITQSGAASTAKTAAQAEALTGQLMDLIGARSIDDLLEADLAELLHAEESLSKVGTVIDRVSSQQELMAHSMVFQPVLDGFVLDRLPLDSLSGGAASSIDLMTGTNSDEYLLWTVADRRPRSKEVFLQRLANVELDDSHYERFADGSDDHKPATDRLLTEMMFRAPADRMLAAHQGKSFDYEFAFKSKAAHGRLGACHALELPFVFGCLDSPGVMGFLGGRAPAEISPEMQEAWISFARTGNPGWSESPDRKVFGESRASCR